MKLFFKKTISAICILLFLCCAFSQETAETIVKKMDDYAHGKSSELVQKIEIIRPGWKSEMTIKAWTLESTRYAMMLIKEPSRDKGVSYLKRSSEAWNW